MTDHGGQNMVDRLRRVLVRAPDAAFGKADPARWHYTARPDLERAREEHAALVETLSDAGAEIVFHDRPLADHADAIFVHDPALVTDRGAILLRMGKPERRGEEEAIGEALRAAGVPVIGRVEPPATVEGGDLLWLDERTLAVGLGYRTDASGLQALRSFLEPEGVRCLGFDLPYWTGPEACLHLMSLISMVDHDLAVARESLLPVRLKRALDARGIEVVRVPESEFATQGPNVLALAPRDCLLLEENRDTAARLEAAGCRVRTYRGRELSLKAEGGATCLTRPLLRRA